MYRYITTSLTCGLFLVGCGSEGGISQKVEPTVTDEVTGTDGTTNGGVDDGTNTTGQDTADLPNDADADADVDADSDVDVDVDTDSDTDADTGNPYTYGDPDTGLTGDDICYAAAQSGLATYLDPWQTPGDNHVYYCHSGSGSNWTWVDSNISSCVPHLNHTADIFPSTGCDS